MGMIEMSDLDEYDSPVIDVEQIQTAGKIPEKIE
jgi:hypothetical protein